MKKSLKISLFVVLALVLLLFAAWLFRNNMLGYFLSKQVYDQSDGKAELAFSGVHLNVKSGNVILDRPVFTFDSLYIDKQHQIKLQQIVFDTIALERVSFFELLWNKKFRARRLRIEKPDIRFEGGSLEGKGTFRPDSLFAMLNKPRENKTKADVRINLVSIHYGRVSFSADTAESHVSNLVDFTIEMYNLNTSPSPETAAKQILFSDDLLFEISHLNNEILPNYYVNLDRALLSVKKQKLIIDNLLILPKWQNEKGKSRVNLKAEKILMHGLDLSKAKSLKDVGISSIRISDGYVTYYLPEGLRAKSDTLSQKELGELRQKIRMFSLDSLMLRRMDFFNVRSGEDTVTAVHQVNLKINDLVIDSTTVKNPLQLLTNPQIVMNTGKSSFFIREKDLLASFSQFSYSSQAGKIEFNNVRIAGDTTASPEMMEVLLDKLSLNEFNPEKYKPGRPVSVSISAISPRFTIDLDSPLFNKGGGNFNPEAYIHLHKIAVRDANGKVYRKNRFAFDVTGLDFSCGHLSIPGNDTSELMIENPVLDILGITGNVENKKYVVSTGTIHYGEKAFTVNNLKGDLAGKNKGDQVSIVLDRAGFRNFDPLAVLNNNELLMDSLQLKNPVVQATLSLSGSEGNKPQKFSIDLPFVLGIGNLGLSHAVVKLNLKSTDQLPIEFTTNLNAGLQNIFPGSRVDSSMIDQLKGTVEFLNMDGGMLDHRSEVQTLAINLSDQSLKLRNLKISGIEGRNSELPVLFHDLDLKELDIEKLNYPLLVKYDSIVFGKLTVNHILSDVTIRQKGQGQSNENQSNDFAGKLLNIVYDSISFNHIYTNISQVGDSVNSSFRLADFHLSHYNGTDACDNLMQNMRISFDSLAWSDTLKNKSLLIDHVWNNPEDQSLIIEHIKTGDFFENKNITLMPDSSGFWFTSGRVILSGVNLKQGLPSRLSVNAMTFDTLSFYLVQKKKTQKSGGNLKLDMDFIESYAGLMSGLKVDTTYLNNISLQYYSLGDSAFKPVRVNNIALKVRGLNIDSSMASRDIRDMVKNMTIDLRGRSYITADSMYEIQSGLIRYDFPRRAIIIDSFYVMPRYPRMTFFEKAHYQTDRVKVFGKRMELRDFDFDDFFDHNHIHFGMVRLDQADLRLYRDMKYPLKPGIYKPMPQEILRNLKQKFTIDTIDVRDSYLLYGEYSKKSDKPGIAYFKNFNINAYHLTNNFSSIPDTTNLMIKLNTRVMGDARMDAVIRFPLLSQKDEFTISASSERMDMPLLSQLTENILGISIVSGKGRIDYANITGDNKESHGKMLFKYRKFKLKMYDTEKSKVSSGFFAPVFNFMINGLMIKSYNPRFARTPREGIVYYQRDTKRSIINYLWKSLLSGMLSTMGINTKEQRQQKKMIKKEAH